MDEKKDTNAVNAPAEQKPVPAPTTLGAPTKGFGHNTELDEGDFEIPRAKVIQFTSDEAKAADVNERIAAGSLINSISKKVLSPIFIPIKSEKSYVRWNAMKKDDPAYDSAYEPGELIFSTKDRHDQRVMEGINFGPNGEAPKVKKVLSFLCYFEGQKLPLLLSFTKTSYKGARRLNTLLEEAGGNTYDNKFKLVVTLESKNGNDYYTINVVPAGKATPDEFAFCDACFKRFQNLDAESMTRAEDKLKADSWEE